MIKTVVIGAAGRMGRRLVANIAESKNLILSGALESKNCPFLGQDAGQLANCANANVAITSDLSKALERADSVINFATENVLETTRAAVSMGCSVVIGTTALNQQEKAELAKLAQAGGRIVSAYNMSIGVNLLFKLVKESATILGANYDVEITEMHHNQKKDAPSGTAVRLAEVVCEAWGWDYDKDVRHGREGIVGERSKHEIGMHSLRGGDVVGDHTVTFAINGERVELTHKASSRDTFAKGALRAVEFLATAKPGLYDMQDVLGLK
ncbi:MAG: 4-hydroxy-tetrahydrodipicolinate reductase [Victivallales bacterium]|jgi:4-hydroxy-tetrahydrodipicolinate reductase|nr:4-hydroxy-tetrahydrodipicolinate reductase [Victivallales bacterium]